MLNKKPTYEELETLLKAREDELNKLQSAKSIENSSVFNDLFIENHTIMLIVEFETGKIINANKEACNFYGYSYNELVEMNINQINILSDEQIKQEMYKAKMAINHRFKFNHKLKNGNIKNVEVNSGKIRFNNKEFLLSIIIDITELLKAEEKVIDSEEKYRSLYNNAPLSYQSLNEEGCFIDVNPMWLKTLGYEKEEVIGKWFGDFLHPDYVEHFRINFSAFKKRGYVSDVQFILRKKDGNFIYVSFEGCIGYTPDGKFKQTYCVFKDITEQKALEKHLILSKEQAELNEIYFRSVFENSPTGLSITGLDGSLKTNKAFKDMLGYSHEEFQNLKFSEITHPDDIQTSNEIVETLLKAEKSSIQFEKRYIHKNGSIINTYLLTTLQCSTEGKPLFFLTSVYDITERKQREIELQNAKIIAERNEQKFRSLFRSMQEGVYLHEIIYNQQGKAVNYRIIEANPISEKYLNIKVETAIDKLATELFGTPEPPFLDIYAKVAETGEPFTFEQYFEPMNKHFQISVFSAKKGEFATAFLDITKNKNYENELISAKERLKFALEGSNDGLWDVEMKSGTVYISPRGCEILGYGLNGLEEVTKVWSVWFT